MEKIVYTDGTKVCMLDKNGQKIERESGFIAKYKENSRRIYENNAWKRDGMNARLRGDYDFGENNEWSESETPAILNGVTFTSQENVAAYSFTVGQSSGIYYKDFSREKDDETHLIHSSSEQFFALSYNPKDRTMSASMRKNGDVCESVVVFTENGDYIDITDGDSLDQNPYCSPTDGKILFDSAGVGRDERGNFVTYGNSAVFETDRLTANISLLKEDEKYSYLRPKRDKEGNLYAVKRPAKEKSETNPILEILLIPVRIVEAIVGFVQFFVVLFAGKTLVAGKGGGVNPVREKKITEREIFLDGNRVRVDKELKKNKRFKEKDYGFVPRSRKLVKLSKDGAETVLKNGVADYAIGEEGIYCTDGRHIYLLAENECKKLADVDFCLHLDVKRK